MNSLRPLLIFSILLGAAQGNIIFQIIVGRIKTCFAIWNRQVLCWCHHSWTLHYFVWIEETAAQALVLKKERRFCCWLVALPVVKRKCWRGSDKKEWLCKALSDSPGNQHGHQDKHKDKDKNYNLGILLYFGGDKKMQNCKYLIFNLKCQLQWYRAGGITMSTFLKGQGTPTA